MSLTNTACPPLSLALSRFLALSRSRALALSLSRSLALSLSRSLALSLSRSLALCLLFSLFLLREALRVDQQRPCVQRGGGGGGDAVTQFRDHIKLDEIEKVESAKDGASSLSYAGFFWSHFFHTIKMCIYTAKDGASFLSYADFFCESLFSQKCTYALQTIARVLCRTQVFNLLDIIFKLQKWDSTYIIAKDGFLLYAGFCDFLFPLTSGYGSFRFFVGRLKWLQSLWNCCSHWVLP